MSYFPNFLREDSCRTLLPIRYPLLFLGVAALLCAETPVDTSKIQKAFGKVPLHFEPVAGSAAFAARGQGYSFQVT